MLDDIHMSWTIYLVSLAGSCGRWSCCTDYVDSFELGSSEGQNGRSELTRVRLRALSFSTLEVPMFDAADPVRTSQGTFQARIFLTPTPAGFATGTLTSTRTKRTDSRAEGILEQCPMHHPHLWSGGACHAGRVGHWGSCAWLRC